MTVPGPKVSVLMAVHNGASHLREAVAGILSQRFRDFEFLILDDGSTDDTATVLGSFTDPRVRLFRHDRMGLTRSLIRGLDLANGEYVARQDADDVSCPDRLAKQVVLLDAAPDVALVGSGVRAITEDDHVLRDFTYPTDHGGLVAQLWRLVSPLPHTTIMFRRAIIRERGGYRDIFVKAQDYDMYLRLSETHRLASIPEPLCQLRFSSRSATMDMEQGATQFEYAVLALVTAMMRREMGTDPLEHAARDAFLEQFRRWYVSSSYPRRFRSRLLRRRARLAWTHRQVTHAALHLARAACFDPEWVASALRMLPARDESGDAARWVRSRRSLVA